MRTQRILLTLGALLAIAACERGGEMQGGSTTRPQGASLPADSQMSSVPLGAPPGQPVSIATQIANPFEGDASAVQQGKSLFASMNCVYCHGPQAAGLMGPSLQDGGWRYGGAPAEIFNSVHDGRPKGMPAYGGRLPPAEIWKIVAYVETLGGAEPPATPGMAAMGPTAPTPSPEPAGQLDLKQKWPSSGSGGARDEGTGAKGSGHAS